MKKGKKYALTALSAALIASLGMGSAMVAFADDEIDEGGNTAVETPAENDRKAAYAMPVLDADSAETEILEGFWVPQKDFTADEEAMRNAPEMAEAGLEYRLSEKNGDMVEVKGGSLVFDATKLSAGDSINFQFESKSKVNGKYFVLKVKTENRADLKDLRFALITSGGEKTKKVSAGELMADVDYPTPLTDAKNPYKDGDWYYIVADIAESGLPVSAEGYIGMDMDYSGKDKLSIDNVFFCNEIEVNLEDKEDDLSFNERLEFPAEEEVSLAIPNGDGFGTTLSFNLTAGEDFDIKSLGLEFGDLGIFWASEKDEGAGTLTTRDGETLGELTFEEEATRVVLDLAASGIVGAFDTMYVRGEEAGTFVMENFVLHTVTPAQYVEYLDTEHQIRAQYGEANIKEGEYFGGHIQLGEKQDLMKISGAVFCMDVTVTGSPTWDKVHFNFDGSVSRRLDELYTTDGIRLSEVKFEEGKKQTVYIDLEKSGITLLGNIDTGIDGSDFKGGTIKIGNICITPIVNLVRSTYDPMYAEQLTKLRENLDTDPPTVSITTKTTATAGNRITVQYTKADNVGFPDYSDVVKVTKDGKDVELDENNRFVAEEGVYTVTVTVYDLKGNEGSATIEITVSAASNPGGGTTNPGGGTTNPGGGTTNPGGGTTKPGDQTKPDEPASGLGGGAIAGIVIGCVIGVAAIAVGVFFLIRFLKNRNAEYDDEEYEDDEEEEENEEDNE